MQVTFLCVCSFFLGGLTEQPSYYCLHHFSFSLSSLLSPSIGYSNLSFALCSRCGRPEGCRILVYRGIHQELVNAARMWALM